MRVRIIPGNRKITTKGSKIIFALFIYFCLGNIPSIILGFSFIFGLQLILVIYALFQGQYRQIRFCSCHECCDGFHSYVVPNFYIRMAGRFWWHLEFWFFLQRGTKTRWCKLFVLYIALNKLHFIIIIEIYLPIYLPISLLTMHFSC